MKNNLRKCQSCETCRYSFKQHDYEDDGDCFMCNLDGRYKKEGYSWNEDYYVSDNRVCDDWEGE